MNSHQLLQRAPEQRPVSPPQPEGRVLELEPATHAAGRPDHQRESRYRYLLLTGDALAASLGVLFACAVGKTTHVTVQCLGFVLLAPGVAKILGLYDRDQARLRKSTLDEAPVLLQLSALLSSLALVLSPIMLGGILGPREAIAMFVALFVGLAVGRATARRLAGAMNPPERCLFIGPGDEAFRFRERLEHDHATNATLVAQLELHDAAVWASPTLSERGLADVRALTRRLGVERVIIAPHASGNDEMLDLVRTFGAISIPVSVVPALLQVVGSAVEFDDVHGIAVLGIRSLTLPRSSRIVKRAFDVLGASMVLAGIAPLMAVTALLVKLTSAGPVFFRQERVGRDGKGFELLKFRSMVIDAEAKKAELAAHNQAADGFFKIADDPRITRVGRVLRRTNLDELPQLINVLRGEMSLVGPRPLIPAEDELIVGWHRRRLVLTPGITGHWQVLGSSRVPLDEMVAIDYLYVSNWSLWLDFKLLLRTVPHVLARRGL
ncbi:MAG TPA: sugar transferase [Solirubrobacteraceae bacterium]|jgi:exopolysaccharide biosynthesis polyprenyl glycosylphosphotransferase